MRKIVLIFVFSMFSIAGFAQINELGIFAGGSNYIGDIGRTNYIYPNSYAIGGIYKWNMHPHYSIRANYTYAKIRASDADADNSFRRYRNEPLEPLSFENDLHELVAGIEYHFFKYNLSKTGYTTTPYLFVQGGAVSYGTLEGRRFNFVLPFGAGIKTKLAPGVGIGLDLGFRYTFRDDIDRYPDDPDALNVQVNPDDNDWYVFTGITLVFAFGREGCYTGSF